MSRRKRFHRFCAVVALASLLTGCSCLRTTVEVPVYLHDTTYSVREVHDSIHTDHWHTIKVKGDTTFIRDSLTFYRYIIRTDTAYKYVERPVEVTIEHIKEVEKPLTWLQRTLIYIGIGALVFALLWVLWKVLLRRWLPTKLPTKNGN